MTALAALAPYWPTLATAARTFAAEYRRLRAEQADLRKDRL